MEAFRNKGVPAHNRIPVLCVWGLGTKSGWGVYGLNLALNWADDPDLSPFFGLGVEKLPIDALRMAKLSGVLRDSSAASRILQQSDRRGISLNGIALYALINGLRWGPMDARDRIRADAHLGVVFFEDTDLNADARERAARLELIVAGSTWNAEVLRAAGIGPVACVLQGVDPTLFHPAPQSGIFKNRFMVFSGGKLEARKGQDLVLLAFKRFAARHPDALLVTAWHSPWPKLAKAVGHERGMAPVTFNEKGEIEVVRWAVDNGLKSEQVLDIGLVPNPLMPTILREMSAALFMNRCEGGTNLVAMECMACGVPTILSSNTGHLDLLGDSAAIALTRQTRPAAPPDMRGTEGWGESDVEEAAAALEMLYTDRASAAQTGRRGATLLAGLSWARQTALLKETIRPFIFRTAR